MSSTTAGTAGRITGRAVVAATRAARTARHIAAQIDWVEVGRIVLHGLVAAAVLAYLAGHALGTAVHRANDWLSARWVALLVKPEAAVKESLTAEPEVPAPAPAPARPAMAVAVDLVRHQQISQRQAARRAGVSRTALQRALAAA